MSIYIVDYISTSGKKECVSVNGVHSTLTFQDVSVPKSHHLGLLLGLDFSSNFNFGRYICDVGVL